MKLLYTQFLVLKDTEILLKVKVLTKNREAVKARSLNFWFLQSMCSVFDRNRVLLVAKYG
jgi:hypothetical protein